MAEGLRVCTYSGKPSRFSSSMLVSQQTYLGMMERVSVCIELDVGAQLTVSFNSSSDSQTPQGRAVSLPSGVSG